MPPIRSGFSISAVVVFMAWALAAAPAPGAVDIPDAAIRQDVERALFVDPVTEGVVAVNNNLTVDRTDQAVTYNPYVDGSDVYERDWYQYTPRRDFKSDEQLRKDILMNLYWSPFIDSDQVEITVEDGTAILSGTVASINESQAARRAALNAGADRVRNRLSVE